MVLTADDLYLSRRLWYVSLHKKSVRAQCIRACDERGIVVRDGMTRVDMCRLWAEDVADETVVINACRRMATKRGIDLSDVPMCVYPPKYRPPPLREENK